MVSCHLSQSSTVTAFHHGSCFLGNECIFRVCVSEVFPSLVILLCNAAIVKTSTFYFSMLNQMVFFIDCMHRTIPYLRYFLYNAKFYIVTVWIARKTSFKVFQSPINRYHAATACFEVMNWFWFDNFTTVLAFDSIFYDSSFHIITVSFRSNL